MAGWALRPVLIEVDAVVPHLNCNRSLKLLDSQLPLEISHIRVSASDGISEQDRQKVYFEGALLLSSIRTHGFDARCSRF